MSLQVFGMLYFPHYFTLEPAEFHAELAGTLQDENIKFLDIVGFRGSAKSTFVMLLLALQQGLYGLAHFIPMIKETTAVAEIELANLVAELETNPLLKEDFAQEIGDKHANKWTEKTIVLGNGVRYLAMSRGQKIRGLRHRQYRPDLVLMDDVEDEDRIHQKNYRDKTENWVLGSVIPAIEETTARLIIIGNMLHTDGLMARLAKNDVFTHRRYALIDKDGHCTWRGKYPTEESLKAQEAKVKRTIWMREYCLKVVPPEGRAVKEEWIVYYDDLPEAAEFVSVGVDLAISKKETADFTAMVSGILAHIGNRPIIPVLSEPINAHLSFLETITTMSQLLVAHRVHGMATFYVEQVQYQQAAVEMAQNEMIPAEGVKVSSDKRARLKGIAMFIENGTVQFPRKGCEDLIDQLVNFGITDHDDLADAFVYMVMGVIGAGLHKEEMFAV